MVVWGISGANCRGAACRSRRYAADPNRLSLKWKWPQICHCEGALRPWQSREGTGDSHRPPLKWYAPIASVAALSERHWQLQISVYPADRTGHQICHCEEAVGRRGNLGKALPEWERHRRPYTPPGLTVAALSERHASWQSLRHAFCGARPSSLSLRGPKGAVAP